jgi:intein/homing endonuclease
MKSDMLSALLRHNPLQYNSRDDVENPHIFLLRTIIQPENFYFTCKHIFNVKLAFFQIVILQQLWRYKYPMLIGARGMSKSFLLALYAMLRATLNQGCKVVIVGSSFRPAKVVFEYCEKIWNNAPVLRDLIGQGSGIHHNPDKWYLNVGESQITALPMGVGGDKIRGQRANYTIADEFATIPLETFQNVVEGFGAVNLDPVESMYRDAERRAMKKAGAWTERMESEFGKISVGNQTVVSGTANYTFNHFYSYWRKYKAIIESGGDEKRLEEVFHGEIPEKFDYRDYCIIRIPHKLLPQAFMDEKHIARAKATQHIGSHTIEYEACQILDTKVITNLGCKNIQDLQVGDLVLTHKGRFRPVLKVLEREINQKILKYRTLAYGSDVGTTADHPFWQGEENWLPAVFLHETRKTYLANLLELNNKEEIDARDFVKNYGIRGDYIYINKSSLTNEQIEFIRLSKEGPTALSKKFGLTPGAIHYIKTKKTIHKNAIKYKIKLDYNFGLIIGYYAAEGSRGGKGRSVSFALDGHHDVKLESFVKELVEAIKIVFCYDPALYYDDKANVVDVYISSRMISELIGGICPGKSHTKYILPDILFSNKEFLKGFVVGYWNGDGHRPTDSNEPTLAGSVSESLLVQVKLALSYFGIASAFGSTMVVGGFSPNGTKLNRLHFYGDNARRFTNVFYNTEIPFKKLSRITNDGEKSILPLIKYDVENYEGKVYNLEVEEDNSYSLLNSTVHNCFSGDSQGFFRRSLIESCVTNSPLTIKSGRDVQFDADIYGNKGLSYILAFDTASEKDKFAIVILELHEDHRRIVYCWTTDRKSQIESVKDKSTIENNFYAYCARKIRNLMKVFNIIEITCDAQGGGIAVYEALHDKDKLEQGEIPIWEVIEDGKEKPFDDADGLHILRMIQFANAKWVAEANHGMKKDFEEKILLFPMFDAIRLVEISVDDIPSQTHDTLENNYLEIEELKSELSTIIHSMTSVTGREHWDTPEIKQSGGRKGRMRKDRYSALLMANMAARTIALTPPEIPYRAVGGWAKDAGKMNPNAKMYRGPEWFTKPVGRMGPAYGRVIPRRK